MRIIALLLAASFLNACSAGSIAGPSDTRLVATWVQREAVAGTIFTIRLDAQGTNVTGSGTYTVEGGRSGTVTATGTSGNGTLRLAIAYDSGEAAQFNGDQISNAELSGVLHLGAAQSLTPSHVVTFDRKY